MGVPFGVGEGEKLGRWRKEILLVRGKGLESSNV